MRGPREGRRRGQDQRTPEERGRGVQDVAIVSDSTGDQGSGPVRRAPEPSSPVGQAHALEEASECGVNAARPEVGEPHGPLLVAPPGQRVVVRR